MKTTMELPDDLAREAKARAAREGRTLPDLVAEALRALLHGKSASTPARGSAGDWARKFFGAAALAPGETTDDVRSAYYRKKYGFRPPTSDS
jgi:plasmid stability protein